MYVRCTPKTRFAEQKVVYNLADVVANPIIINHHVHTALNTKNTSRNHMRSLNCHSNQQFEYYIYFNFIYGYIEYT